MTDVIAEPCTGVKDKACAGDCQSAASARANGCSASTPGECAGCGACEPACPAGAIVCEDDVPGRWAQFTAANAKFSGQFGSPGGAAKTRPLPDGTDHVPSYVTSR